MPQTQRVNFTTRYLNTLKAPQSGRAVIWDATSRGLGVTVQATGKHARTRTEAHRDASSARRSSRSKRSIRVNVLCFSRIKTGGGGLRKFPEQVPELQYPSSMEVRRVKHRGHFRWNQQDVFLTEVLWGEPVGLLPIDGRHFTVYFGPYALARFDSHESRVSRSKSKGSYREEEEAQAFASPASGPAPQHQKVSGMCPV